MNPFVVALALPDERTLSLAATIAIVFVLAAIVVRIGHVILQRILNALDVVGDENRKAIHARGKRIIHALTLLVYGVAVFASVSLTFARLGLGGPTVDLLVIGRWVLVHGINVTVIVVGATIVIRTANLAIEHLQHKLSRRQLEADLEAQRRAATLGAILANLVKASVGFFAVLMLLRELSIDILPILTGAGIAGLAVGFGAQNLVRDVISGFFLILEDQVRVGDSVRINNVGGIVEQIKLRTIVLRDGEGAVQVFPNGTVTSIANLSKQFAYAIVDVRAAYTESIERVFGTIRDVGASMQQEAAWGSLVLAPLEVTGIESLADGAATIRVRFKTLPFRQGQVANELRRRLMTTFVRHGIKPYASR